MNTTKNSFVPIQETNFYQNFKNMKLSTIFTIIILSFGLFLFGCEKEPDAPKCTWTCENGEITNSCSCNCFPGYYGSRCQYQEVVYTGFKIYKIEASNIRQCDALGNQYDYAYANDETDVFFQVEWADQGPIYKTATAEDATQVTFDNLNWIFDDLSETIKITMNDFDYVSPTWSSYYLLFEVSFTGNHILGDSTHYSGNSICYPGESLTYIRFYYEGIE
jgi:hypothetical protein